ncbi:MAG: hypothetical protein ACK55I_31420, partial [bacterium]
MPALPHTVTLSSEELKLAESQPLPDELRVLAGGCGIGAHRCCNQLQLEALWPVQSTLHMPTCSTRTTITETSM